MHVLDGLDDVEPRDLDAQLAAVSLDCHDGDDAVLLLGFVGLEEVDALQVDVFRLISGEPNDDVVGRTERAARAAVDEVGVEDLHEEDIRGV